MLCGDYSRVVVYPFSNIRCFSSFKAYTSRQFLTAWWKNVVILRYPSQCEAPLHSAIEVLSRAGLVLVTPRSSLDLAAEKQLYQSLLLSPKLSGEGAAFPEVSNGKRYRGVSRWFRKAVFQNAAWSGGSDIPSRLGIEDGRENLLWSTSMSFIKLSNS